MSLAGPAAARRRAAQRTRHQVTGGVLAGVTAVALGVLAVSPPEFIASPEPVDSPSETGTPTAVPTPEPTPSTTTPVEPTPDPTGTETPGGDDGQDGGTGGDDGGGGTSSLAVPPGALIDLEYLTRGEEFPSDWVEVPAGDSWLPCMPVAGDGAAAAAFAVEPYYRVEHIVEPAGAGAEARLAELRDQITSCANGDDHNLIQEWQVGGVGDETYLLVWRGPPSTADTQTYVEASLTRAGGFVDIVVRGGEGQDYNGVAQPNDAVEATSRLCAVADTECPSEPEREQLYPEPAGDVDGWLTADDLSEAGLEALSQGSDVLSSNDEGGPAAYGYVAFTRDPFADGAEVMEQRYYSDPLEPGGPNINQERATFPNAEAARAHYAELMAAVDQFTQPGDVMENTGSVSTDGYEATTWRSENAEFGSVFLSGAAVSGNVVTVVYYGVDQVDLSPEQMQRLMELAAQRIGG
ncbi:hypothetical protein [Jiangella alkaliphila]|nr:hypothetical protein [Jiangella alkaliphila]